MIYSVEDDVAIRELICYTLSNQGYESVGFEDGKSFYDAMENEIPQLILLDIMLPKEDGISILKNIKSNALTKDIAVIMLSAKDSEIDKVTSLDLGADDYISKPFGMMELLSRIKAVLRRKNGNIETKEIILNDIKIDVKNYKVYVLDEEVSLTLKEFNLLKYMLSNVNIVLTREQILEKLWGYDESVESRTLDSHVKSLRQKLGTRGEIIETVRGVGYVIRG